MSKSNQFQPDWASSPGETILDILREREFSDMDFADLMSLTPVEANDLLLGRKSGHNRPCQTLDRQIRGVLLSSGCRETINTVVIRDSCEKMRNNGYGSSRLET